MGICPFMQGKPCERENCELWQGELEIKLDDPMAQAMINKALSTMGYTDGKIPAMCSIKYRSRK